MPNQYKKISFAIIFGLLIISLPLVAHAGFLDIGCVQAGNCDLPEMMEILKKAISWAITFSGALALLMFIIGGVFMLTSAGNQTRVQRGKDILVGTTMALFIIFGSWLIVNFVLEAFTKKATHLTSFCAGQSNGTTCGANLEDQCYQGLCISRCEYVGKNDPDHNWACRSTNDCGISSPEQCSPPNCQPDICPANTYCCYYEILDSPLPGDSAGPLEG